MPSSKFWPYFVAKGTYVVIPSHTWMSRVSMRKKFRLRVIRWVDIEFAHNASPEQRVCVNKMLNVLPLQSRESYCPGLTIE